MGGLQAWLNPGSDMMSSSHQTLIFPTCFIFNAFFVLTWVSSAAFGLLWPYNMTQ